MSFSIQAKNELCRVPLCRPCCILAEAYGALLFGSTFSHREIRLITENPQLANRLRTLFFRAFGVSIPVKTGSKQVLLLTEERALRVIFNKLGYDYKSHLRYHLNRNIIENDCCQTAFLRGVFLMGGTVAGPDKKGHLEIKTAHQSLCREIISLMLDMQLSPKATTRGNAALIYFKETARIEDFLTLIGARQAALAMMQAKIEKDMHNTVNRQANCAAANLDKAAGASARQVLAIQRVLAHGGVFPENLQETVQLRLANPTASLAELADLFDPPISKPGVSHRMRRIIQFSEHYTITH